MRILFVALSDSVHTARWISQLHGLGWDLHLFPYELSYALHPDLRGVSVHGVIQEPGSPAHDAVRQTGLAWPFRRGRARTLAILRRLASLRFNQGARLARTIRDLQPDIVHSLEMQRAGYLTLEAREELGPGAFPPWIYSSWGNDIYLFGRRFEHEARVRNVLRSCDFLIADCERDIALSRQLGFRGRKLGVFPTAGGYDISRMQEGRQSRPAERRLVMIKGYQSDTWGGRALVALQAVGLCAETLAGYGVVVYSASPESEVGSSAREVGQATGLDISVLPSRPHHELLKLFGQARVAVGLSVSDGTPNTMLEAMIMGAFPVQSDTVSTGEWIDNGRNGLLVPAEDPAAVADAIRRAVTDDTLVNQAADFNDRMTRSRVEMSIVKPRVIEAYRRAAAWQQSEGASENTGPRRERETEVVALDR
jgi:glycosyltransferase involved in cell wall biosynthesis